MVVAGAKIHAGPSIFVHLRRYSIGARLFQIIIKNIARNVSNKSFFSKTMCLLIYPDTL